ncbi:hypothetical protein [uncultured Ruegeria sp.]|uniref:hypothetical protein n=1 Tax=uncultured Ruegeria sp. TaxID=259304 RepID=UPI00262009D9|nr:hypothetical protein [uncultured Ruegeria sp.]
MNDLSRVSRSFGKKNPDGINCSTFKGKTAVFRAASDDSETSLGRITPNTAKAMNPAKATISPFLIITSEGSIRPGFGCIQPINPNAIPISDNTAAKATGRDRRPQCHERDQCEDSVTLRGANSISRPANKLPNSDLETKRLPDCGSLMAILFPIVPSNTTK